jgi:hypothetical protein
MQSLLSFRNYILWLPNAFLIGLALLSSNTLLLS